LIFSRIYNQLLGYYVDYEGLKNARPYRSVDDSPYPDQWILPSGAFAHYVFNDTFIWLRTDIFDSNAIVSATESGYLYQPLSEEYQSGNKWLRDNPVFPHNETDPHFIAWMRISAASTIVKDYSICSGCALEKGDYQIAIQSNCPTYLSGAKYLLVSESTSIGDRNLYLGILYIVVSFLLFGYAMLFLVANWIYHPSRVERVENAVP
jgi:hypothetical protein